MLTSSYPDLVSNMKNYKDAVDACHTFSKFTIFQSNVPWGPWKIVYEGRGTGTVDYLPRLPCKWIGDAPGQSAIVSAGNFESRPDLEDHYGFVVGKMSWEIK